MIDSFTGEFRFLSNFFPAEVVLDGVTYPTVEHAYQACKTLLDSQRLQIWKAATPAIAKRLGKQVDVRPRWNDIKVHEMRKLLAQKFRHEHLQELLLATRGQEVVEGNWWGDPFWGVYEGKGENWLGKLLMEVRDAADPTQG